jgi:hypothetical protein
MARAAAAKDGTATLENNASWNGETGTAPVVYTYKGLKKEILTSDADLKKTDEDIFADFRITLNPSGQLLNGGLPLTMTDTVSNMSVVLTSIAAVPSQGVTWDMTGNTVTYTIPDATKVVITYRARVLFPSIGKEGDTVSVTFGNVAEMLGYRDEIEKTAERHNDGWGGGNVFSINLLKYEGGNMTKRLEGAVFALLDSNKNPVLDKNNHPVTFETDENGLIKVEGDEDRDGWAIIEDTRYYLRETKAPEGYIRADFDYSFQVSSDGTTNYSDFIYHSGDTMSAKNYPKTDVNVEKKWEAGNDRHSSDMVTVKLQQKIGEGEFSDTIRVLSGGSWDDKKGQTTIVLSNVNNWKGAFNELPAAVPPVLPDDGTQGGTQELETAEYRVVETLVNNDAPAEDKVQITGGKTEGTYSYTITNKEDIELVDLEVEKTWVNADGSSDWPEGVTVDIQLTADGNAVEGKTAALSAANPSYTFEDLPRRTEDGREIVYSVNEVKINGYSSQIGGIADGKITITNTQETTEVRVDKKWVNADGSEDWPEGAEASIQLTAGGQPVAGKTITLSKDQPEYTFSGLANIRQTEWPRSPTAWKKLK